MSRWRRAAHRLVNSRWGTPLRPLHRAAVATMLAAVGERDRRRFAAPPDERLAREVTLTVKTFERPDALARHLRTARRVFAGRIVVADDSRVPWTSDDPDVEVVALPFNSGVSKGRNAALDRVRTPFVLVCDDDIVFTHGTDWTLALDYLDRNPDVDGVAATLIELPGWYSNVTPPDPLLRGHAEPRRAHGELVDGLPVNLKPPQVYLARTESTRSIRWNEELRMMDHNDFMSRASGRLVFVQDPDIACFHARTPWNRFYTRHREDIAADKRVLGRLWNSRRTA